LQGEGFLVFHHVVPFADGLKTTVANLQLRCRAHNAHEAERRFGTMFVALCFYDDQPRCETIANSVQLFEC